MTLEDYQRKRNLKQTPEPRGLSGVAGSHSGLCFVVQKHNARSLHFDFRLEHDGVLKSWAIPRGPSLDPKVKRLAVEVEDHPLDYADFEGVIPEGHYGAGRVLVWDTGTWQPHGDVAKMLRTGKIRFRLSGQLLLGDWVLIRTTMKGKQQQWLLSKHQDDEARSDVDVVKQFPDGVLSQSMENGAETNIGFILPKLPTMATAPPRGLDWVHEMKLDGYRMQAQWGSDGFQLLTRSGYDWTHRYRIIADELAKLDWHGTILDGELVALDDDGKSNFDLLQQATSRDDVALAYFAFDLLFLRNEDQRKLPLLDRKASLRSLIDSAARKSKAPRLQYLDHIASGLDAFVDQSRALGLEGIVSKRVDGAYKSGRASDWLKTKFRYRESLVVVGYETSGKPPALSSLLVAFYDRSDVLQLAGRVGTGWDEKVAALIIKRLQTLPSTKSHLASKLPKSKRAHDRNIELFWVQPVVVADVNFASWTESNQLRHASFVSFNEHTLPQDVKADQLFADRNTDVVPTATTSKKSNVTRPMPSASLPGLSNPDRVLYPDDHITKADIAAYLFQVNQWLLAHVANRPVSLLRCSEGIGGDAFFQRHPGKGFPSQIERLAVETEDEPLICINDLSALLASAQISAIELHPWGCRSDDIEHPDRLIIDLDPDESLAWNIVVEAAFIVRAALEVRDLQSFVKTTGGKGLHVVAPLNRDRGWDQVFEFSKSLASDLARIHKNLFVANMSKSRRRGRIFLDYHRNRRGSTAIAAYSLRARPGASASTPISWDELPLIHPSQFTIRTIPPRLARLAIDPWAAIVSIEQ